MGLAAVTGATGFLGRHLVAELAAKGWRVRVLARREVIHPLWRDLEPEVVLGDLADERALDRLTAGADVVVHAAGLTKAWDRAGFAAVNVEGTRRLAERTAGAMLLMSSLAAREPDLSDYASTKREGEETARRILDGRLTVVRPPALYGPDDPETLPLFQAAASSPILPLLDPAARITLMHVADAARQIAALAEGPWGQTGAISDLRPEGYGWRDIFETACAAFGTKPSLIRVPKATLGLAAAMGALNRRGPAPMLSHGKVREILHRDWSLSPNERFQGLPTPRFDLYDGFIYTVEAYRRGGVVFGKFG